jgi:hypothetical protein
MVDEPQPTSRRFRERQRRTRRQRRVNTVGTVLTFAVVALVVLVATDTWRLGDHGPTLASGKTKPVATAPDASNAIANLKVSNPPRPLSHAAPLRLWVGGDSLAGDLGYQLGPMLGNTGIVTAHVDYKVSSGLASHEVRDWPSHFPEENSQYRPEALVFMIGANDASIVGSAKDSSGNPAWQAKYRAQVDEMMNLLIGQNRTVFWIGSPTLGTKYDHGASEVDRVMREEAAKHPTSVVYIDAYSLFSENGEYSSYLDDATGERVRMRTGDGVHFTVEGAQYLAQKVYALLNSRWNLDTQAARAEPIPYTIEPSSGTIGGVHLSNHYHSSTTTAAPVTTQPTASTKPPATTAAPTTTKSTPTTGGSPTPTTDKKKNPPHT